ncbi:MAG: hypothetical protein V1802_01470 [Candidatus Aenigmatarchaeota archaeon]
MAEATEDKHPKHKKISIWHITTILFAVLFVGALVVIAIPKPGINSNEAGNKVVDYINKNMPQLGITSLINASEKSGLYGVNIKIIGTDNSVNAYTLYVTKDGQLFFTSPPIGMNAEKISAETQEIPKKDKPTLDLYVWTNCPYGVEAEKLVKPVYDLLKNKVDFNLIFIGPVTDSKETASKSCFDGQDKSVDEAAKVCCNNYTINGKIIYSCGLHGSGEALESEREACILKEYGKDSLWTYLAEFVNSKDSNKSMTAAGVKADKINSCMSSYGWYDILIANTATAIQNNIQGSESILLNDFKLSPSDYRWSPEKLKTLICSAFTTQPSECSQTLSEVSGTSATSGGCA